MKIYNLCYVIDGDPENGGDRVLLIRKKRGLGAGKINGIGGTLEEGETQERSVVREVEEEVGIRVKPEFRGIVEFVTDGKLHSLCHVFVARGFEGEPRETDEALPMWFPVTEIPYDEMWEDDKHWLPHVMDGRSVIGRFWFDDWKLKDQRVWVADK